MEFVALGGPEGPPPFPDDAGAFLGLGGPEGLEAGGLLAPYPPPGRLSLVPWADGGTLGGPPWAAPPPEPPRFLELLQPPRGSPPPRGPSCPPAPPALRGAGVRELRGDGDAAVAAGRDGPLPLQRLRALPPPQRPQPAPHPPQKAPAGEQAGRHRLQQLPDQHHHPLASQPPGGPRLQRLRPLLQTAPGEPPPDHAQGRDPDPKPQGLGQGEETTARGGRRPRGGDGCHGGAPAAPPSTPSAPSRGSGCTLHPRTPRPLRTPPALLRHRTLFGGAWGELRCPPNPCWAPPRPQPPALMGGGPRITVWDWKRSPAQASLFGGCTWVLGGGCPLGGFGGGDTPQNADTTRCPRPLPPPRAPCGGLQDGGLQWGTPKMAASSGAHPRWRLCTAAGGAKPRPALGESHAPLPPPRPSPARAPPLASFPSQLRLLRRPAPRRHRRAPGASVARGCRPPLRCPPPRGARAPPPAAMGRAGRRAPPQRGGLPEAKRRGRARSRREGLEAELQRLDLGTEATAPTGTGLVYDERFAAVSEDESTPEGPDPLSAAWATLEELGLVQRCVRVECRPATDEELLLVHSPTFLAQMELQTPGCAPPTPSEVGASRLAAGSLLVLLTKVLNGDLRNGLALLRPPGRHAQPDAASGRRVFNAVAVAARAAQRHLGVRRILIVDWCAQPGQAIPRLFQEDPSVLCFGVHRGEDPPATAGTGRGEGFTVDVRWDEADVTDGDYAAAFFHLLLPIAFEFQPQLVLVAAGFDTALGEPEGHMGVSPDGFALMTHLLSALAGGRLLLALEGGSEPGTLAGALSAILRTLLGDPGDPPGPITPTPSGLASVARTLAIHRKYWSCLRGAEPEVEEEKEEEDNEKEEKEEEDDEEEEEEEDEEDLEDDGEAPATPPEPAEQEELRSWPHPAARTGLLYDERMEEHCNPWDSQHPEAPQRVTRIVERLRELGLAQRCLRLPARYALPAQLRACHTRAHVAALAGTEGLRPRELRGAAERYNSVFLCPRSYACARLAAGTACAAVTAVLTGQVQNALAVVRPPGHHARPGAAGGFCLFNNVAVAARHGQRLAGGALRVLILDWDVHHGNGTQKIFEEDPSVLYISLHRHDGSFFPGGPGGSPRRRGRGRGAGFTLNVGWGGPRAGDPDYLAAMTRLVLPVACQFAPQLVLVSAGFDAGRGDPLGGCLLSPPTFGLMTHLLGGLAGGRLVLVLEGGYNLGVTAEGVGQCLGVLLGAPPALPPPGPPQPAALGALARTRRAQRGSWSCLRLPAAAPPAETPPEPPSGEGSDDVTRSGADITGPPPPLDAILRLGELRLGDPPEGGAGGPGGAEPLPDHALPQGATANPPSPPCPEEELEEEALFAVVAPLLDCPHLGAVAPPPGGRGLEGNPPCGACGSRRENWLCLSCHQVLCGRYVGGHMLEHGGAAGHPLVLSLRDLSAWCYPCGGYVHHPVLLPAKTLLHRLKFGTDPPTPSL
ncbi:protein deacetylase HDAC6 [Morphnus guianensis]